MQMDLLLLCQNMSEFASDPTEEGGSRKVCEINVILQIGTKKWKLTDIAQYHSLNLFKLGNFSI